MNPATHSGKDCIRWSARSRAAAGCDVAGWPDRSALAARAGRRRGRTPTTWQVLRIPAWTTPPRCGASRARRRGKEPSGAGAGCPGRHVGSSPGSMPVHQAAGALMLKAAPRAERPHGCREPVAKPDRRFAVNGFQGADDGENARYPVCWVITKHELLGRACVTCLVHPCRISVITHYRPRRPMAGNTYSRAVVARHPGNLGRAGRYSWPGQEQPGGS